MKPWICPRCLKVNAPWLNQCFCGPTIVPETLPPTKPEKVKDIEVTETGSWVLHIDD